MPRCSLSTSRREAVSRGRYRYRKDLGGEAELGVDRLRAIEAARHDGRDGLADLLDAKPVKPTKRKKQ